MNTRSRALLSVAFVAGLACSGSALAQLGYGVNSNGVLFRFQLNNPNNTYVEIGNTGISPVGIDFRPGTSDLYAFGVGANLAQLYRLDLNTGAASPVGAGFAVSGTVNNVAYNLTGQNDFGFDFNPTTLQGDNSMRIRLVGTNGANLRLNSSTGQIAAVDTNLAFTGGSLPFVSAAAYTNSATATAGGTTALFVMDSRNNALLLQDPPNLGTVTTVGSFGVSITNTTRNISFDILTDPNSNDPTIGGDTGYAVLRRPDAPINGPLNAYLLYNVNLSNGQITNGALVGTGADFQGGFAVLIPAPATFGVLAFGASSMLIRRRRTA